MNEPPDHDENDHSSSDSTTNRTNLVNQEDSLAENELDDDHCDLFSTQLEDEMFRDVQEMERKLAAKSNVRYMPGSVSNAAKSEDGIAEDAQNQIEVDFLTKDTSVSTEPGLFLHDLDTIICENSSFLQMLTQNKSTDGVNLAEKLHVERQSVAENHDFVDHESEVNEISDKVLLDFLQNRNDTVTENTTEQTTDDHAHIQTIHERPVLVQEKSNDNVDHREKRNTHFHTQVSKSVTANQGGISDKTRIAVSSRKRKLSDEISNLNNQSLTQPPTKTAYRGTKELKEIVSGYFEARKGYLKRKSKPSSEVKRENLNSIINRFFSSSQPNAIQVSSISTVTSPFPDMDIISAKMDTDKNITRENSRSFTVEEGHSDEADATSHLSRPLETSFEQVSSPLIEWTGSAELRLAGTDINSALGPTQTGLDDNNNAEKVTGKVTFKHETLEIRDGKRNEKPTKEKQNTLDLICEFDDNEADTDSIVLDIDLEESDRHHRKLSHELLKHTNKDSNALQETQEGAAADKLNKGDEIVYDSNNESDDELPETQTDNMWLNFQFGKYATAIDRGSHKTTVCDPARNAQKASNTCKENQHAIMHRSAESNTSLMEREKDVCNVSNNFNSPKISEAEKTIVTDTPVQFKKSRKSTSRLSIHKTFSSMKSKITSSPVLSLKTNKGSSTEEINGISSSPIQAEQNEVLVPETPVHSSLKVNSRPARNKAQMPNSDDGNLSKRKESDDLAAEIHNPNKVKKETATLKMKEGEIIRRVTQVIHDLKTAFNTAPVRKDSRITALRQELSSLEEKAKIPKTVIAVVGDTGSGKSSILNALLGHRWVLPTSGVRACTAVAVEIEDNPHNSMFEADIEFLTKQEWDQELDVLMKDLTDFKGKFRKSPPKADSDTYISYMKVLAVYGKVDTKENLAQITDVTKNLGETQTISCDDPMTFCKKVEQYITQPLKADGEVVGEFWPIVKLVHFRLPQCDVLSSGAVVVDLPGLKDFNLAREIVAKEYLKNCTAVWIVSSIHRAIDDKTAKTLLDETFQRQLFMDGHYGNVTFICSKTDDLKPSEIIRDLQLETTTQSLEQELSVAETQKSHFEHELKSHQEDGECISSESRAPERQKKGMVTSDASHTQNITKRINQLNLQISMYRRQLYSICAKERNLYAKNQIKKDFAAGYKEMKRQADREASEEYDDYDDDSDDNNDDDDDDSAAEKLQVFCCSANEYQKLKYPSSSDGPPQVFSSVNDSEIPLLRNHVHNITTAGKRPEVEILVENLGQFVFDHKLQKYIAEDIPLTCSAHEEARESIDDLIDSWETKFGPIIDMFTDNIDDGFTAIKRKLEEGVKDAEKVACNTCQSWGSKQQKTAGKSNASKTSRKSANLPFPTYKATISRYGIYKSQAVGHINFNEDLTDPVYKSLTAVWDKVFSDLINKTMQKLKEDFHAAFDVFSLCVKLNELGVKDEKGKNIRSQILRSVMNRLNNMVADLKRIVTNRQREISRMITPQVQELLSPTYKRCQQEHGHGAFQRMKDHLHGAIDRDKHQMFGEAIDKIMSELGDLRDQIVQYVVTESKKIIEDLKAILEPLWEEPDRKERPQCSELRDAIFTACSSVCEIYRLAGITKRERIPQLTPVISTDDSENEENSGPSQHSVHSARNRRPPDLSPAFSILHPLEKVTPGSTQNHMDYSESETVIPSTCPSGESDNRAQTKSRSLNNTQIESATWKHQSSRINRRNPFDFGVDEDPGPSRTIQSSRRTLSQCERSSLTEKQTMKSKLRNFRNESSFTRTKSPDPDLQTIPVSERQQIAMIRQMSNKSSRDKDSHTEEPKDDTVNGSNMPSKKVKASLNSFPSKKSKTKQSHSSQQDELSSLLKEISKHEQQTDRFTPIKNGSKNDNSCENHPESNKQLQNTHRKRKPDENSPVLPQKKGRISKYKGSKSNSIEERIKNLCKNRLLRRHAQDEQDTSSITCSENRRATIFGDAFSDREVRGKDPKKPFKHGIDITSNKTENRPNKTVPEEGQRTGRRRTNSNSIWERSFLKNTLSETIFDSIRREKSGEQDVSKKMTNKLIDPGSNSLNNQEKNKPNTEIQNNSTQPNYRKKGRKVRAETALARKASLIPKDDSLPDIASPSQLKIKEEPQDDQRRTPKPRWRPVYSEHDVIDLTEDSD